MCVWIRRRGGRGAGTSRDHRLLHRGAKRPFPGAPLWCASVDRSHETGHGNAQSRLLPMHDGGTALAEEDGLSCLRGLFSDAQPVTSLNLYEPRSADWSKRSPSNCRTPPKSNNFVLHGLETLELSLALGARVRLNQKRGRRVGESQRPSPLNGKTMNQTIGMSPFGDFSFCSFGTMARIRSRLQGGVDHHLVGSSRPAY